jgi:vacuolar protein sorting-associated protein 13A/C
MEYSEDDFKELENLVYDKFSIKLTETKVLIAESVDRSRQAIQDPSSAEDAHLIDQIDMDFLCEICIVPKTTQLTKIKLSGHLPLVSINFSDRKYKTLMNIIDIIVPSIDDEPSGQEPAHDYGTTKLEDENMITSGQVDNSKKTSYFGKPVWEPSQPELLLLSDTEDSDDDEDSAQSTEGYTSHKSSQTSSRRNTLDNGATQVSNEYKQTNFSLSFQIDRVQATLKEAHSDRTESDILLCDLILENFLLVFTQRLFDMNVDVSLKTLSVIDRMEHGNEFTYLITSDKISPDGKTDEGKKNLVNVQYKKINPKSPEYDSIDQSVTVELSALNIIVTRSSILTLYNFILSTFTGPTKESNSTNSELTRRDRSESRVSIASSVESKKPVEQPNTPQEPGTGVIKVQVCLESLDLILNDDGIRLATGCLSHGDVSVLVKPTTLSVDVKIGNFELKDDTNRPVAPNGDMDMGHSGVQLLYLEGKELATFRYVTYDKEASRYPGYDQLIFLRMGSLRLNFVEHSVHQLMEYGSRFAEMKGVYDAAREAAYSSAQQIQQSEALLHYDIRIRSPTVVFPSTDSKQPRDQMIARLGEISVENKFSESKIELKQDGATSNTIKENTIRARVESINLRSEFMAKNEETGEEQQQVLDILKDLHLEFSVITINHVHGTLIPDTQVNGAVSDIQMNLTQRQFKFLIETSNSITSAFTTGPEVTEELENEDTDQLALQAMQSVGVADGSNARSSEAIKNAAKSEAISKDNTKEQSDEKPWSTLDLNINFKDIKLEIFQSEGSIKEEDFPKWSLASFSLEHTSFKMCGKSDFSSNMELQIESIVLRDTRADVKSEFRDVMNRIRTDGPQLQLRYEASPPNPSSDQTLLVALDTPHIILSVDHIFALQKYFMAPFTVEQETEAQKYAETQKRKASTDLANPQTTRNTTQGRTARATKTQNDDQQTSKGAFYYRINIVDPEIVLLANPALPNSEAIILSAEQILVSQQALMTVNVSKIGMFLCIMEKKSEATIRFIEDFEISMSMESHTSANNNITSIVIDITALILKLSYLDIMVISKVVNRALELLGQSNSAPPPESKVEDGNSDDESVDKISEITAAHTEAPSVMSTSVLRRRMNNEPYIVMSRETVSNLA